MSNNLFFPIALLIIIGVSAYLMFSDDFSTKQVDLAQYKELCLKYKQSPKGTYQDAEIQMLINEVQYLVPEKVEELSPSIRKELKTCAQELTGLLQHDRQ